MRCTERGDLVQQRTSVYVYARDPVSQAGIAGQLRGRSDVELLEEIGVDDAEVALLVADEVDDELLRTIKAIQRDGCPRVVLVVTRLEDAGLLSAVEAGACGMLRRADALPDALMSAVHSAAKGDGTVPPDLLGRLLDQVGRLQRQVLSPRGLSFTGLTDREVDVLRLLADGLDTAEVAGKLCYSERTVKNVVQDITRRHNLRNRTHAVAYAMRQGLI
jgi:DNA-binding NarL/FixJ family response regulator